MAGMKWTPTADQWLAEMYPDTPNRTIAKVLGCSYLAVKNRGTLLGLKKSERYMAETKPGCFKKGQPTWNKGLSYQPGGRIKDSQFKRGHKPVNRMPVGSHRVTKDGILQRKVSDTGYVPRDWRSEHVCRWEEYHDRPVPKGHIVRFRDGDRENFDENNLVLVSRGENAILNKFYSMPGAPAESFDVLLNLAKIKLAMGKRKKEVAA
jgi:hypothetical protein